MDTNNLAKTPLAELNYKKKIEKGTLVLPFVVILIAIYYFSPFSVYLWNASLYSIFHTFYFSFFIVPEDFFIGGAGASGVAFNPFTIIIAVFLSLAPAYLLSRGLYYIAGKVGIKFKLVFSLAVFMILMAIVGIAGGNIEQNKCVEKMSHNEKEYLKNTGVVSFGIDEFVENSPFLIQKVSSTLYEVLDLKYLSGSPGFGRIIVQVEPGHEFEKMCKLSYYNQVSFAVAPTEKELFGVHFSEYWKYIDSTFCDSNQLKTHTKDECMRHVSSAKPLSASVNEIKKSNDNKSIIEDKFIFINGFDKYSFSGSIKSEENSTPGFSYKIFDNLNGTEISELFINEKPSNLTTDELYKDLISQKNTYNLNVSYEKIKLGEYVYIKELSLNDTIYIMRFNQ